jgi:hypothetical protein
MSQSRCWSCYRGVVKLIESLGNQQLGDRQQHICCTILRINIICSGGIALHPHNSRANTPVLYQGTMPWRSCLISLSTSITHDPGRRGSLWPVCGVLTCFSRLVSRRAFCLTTVRIGASNVRNTSAGFAVYSTTTVCGGVETFITTPPPATPSQ